MKKVVDRVKFHSVKALTRLVLAALENASLQVAAQAMKYTNTKLPPIREQSHTVAESFLMKMNGSFDALTVQAPPQEDPTKGFDEIALDEDYVEAVIAMEGMINHARNCDIQQTLSFSTRLDSLFENLHIDETNNPLDPEQIGNAFSEAIQPLGLRAEYLLTIYREFNKSVFHNLEDVLIEANEVLIDLDVMPNLDIKARNKESQKAKRAVNRPTTAAETRAFSDTDVAQETVEEKAVDKNAMFTLLQSLVAKALSSELPLSQFAVDSAEGSKEGTVTDEALAVEQENALFAALDAIQLSLLEARKLETADPTQFGRASRAISESLKLQLGSEELPSISLRQADVINLVGLLYEAIGKDDSLPVVMKELIASTQIAILKIALKDSTFFGDEQHPARVIVNEFAMAGIEWTEPELLASDLVYMKVKELAERIEACSDADSGFLQACINELRAFKSEQTGQDANLEQSLRESSNHSERLDDVHTFVTQKIKERILNAKLDPSIKNVLDTFMHEFLVKLVLKEGPGGSSWKPVMSTIDVLVWTVKPEKQPGDKERFEKINSRLLDNLSKALEIGGASKSKLTKIMRQLKQVQEFSFHSAELAHAKQQANTGDTDFSEPNVAPITKREPPPLPRDDPHLRQIDKLPIGVWLEFKGIAGTPVRCTLAAKIDSIDKMFFVNRQGVKVVELTRMRLARELKAGSVKIVSEGSLVDRAMESVISGLRDSAKPVIAAA